MKILLSGFEPFLDEKLNPTQMMAEWVNSCGFHAVDSSLRSLDVRGIVLPVEFDRAFLKLESERTTFQPDVVVALGLAGGRNTFDIEMLAVNERGGEQTSRGDNQGNSPNGVILPGAPKSLATTLPVEDVRAEFERANLQIRKSYSAGTYVCNDLFFQMQERLRFTRVQSGFIHVPRLLPGERDWSVFETATVAILRAFA